jgi:hypothetical protein
MKEPKANRKSKYARTKLERIYCWLYTYHKPIAFYAILALLLLVFILNNV